MRNNEWRHIFQNSEHISLSFSHVVFKVSIDYKSTVRNKELELRQIIWPGDVDLGANDIQMAF